MVSSGKKPVEKEQVVVEETAEQEAAAVKKEKDAVIASGKSPLDMGTLQGLSVAELLKMARELNVPAARSMKKPALIFEILKARVEQNGAMFGEGVLEILPDGFGFLRSPNYNYQACTEDIYISPSQIRKFELKSGDTVSGQIRSPKARERFFALLRVEAINYLPPGVSKQKTHFDNLTPLYPEERLILESSNQDISMRVMDLLTPVGKGQRGLIVAAPDRKNDDPQGAGQRYRPQQPGSQTDRTVNRRASGRGDRLSAFGP